ncbi:hypothetical protein K2173_003891 [Erythroxylum novogranatense]|uniref:DUF7751 domain-containing protein n=1 Tax=Erythroxylum novogranatense TaxID=1862640 RepID=A0AAV8SJN1_9ROSI|nr:hypothetical protein K2173_003891 [Erythroxylum novogranatense]
MEDIEEKVILNESRSTPLVLFLKDIEKSIVGNQDTYSGLKIGRDVETTKAQANIVSIKYDNYKLNVLFRVGLRCPELETLCIKDQALAIENVEKVVRWALSRHFMHCSTTSNGDANLLISLDEKTLKKLLVDVIPPNEIGVTFDDIGELVMLPLQRPEFFGKGQLTKVDSMLGRRENPGEHEAMRKMKNEFMNLCVIVAHCPIQEILGKEEKEDELKLKPVIAFDCAIGVRDKLESLCRELPRHNKLLMDVSIKLGEKKELLE